ncbi:Na(+)/H(+) antiporter subunit B [Sneathiella sp. P13V-1]|uniref:Na(+)/H(+) antiporter subunit B n=1 Tax=Sneathiella sp. P13V-1 TaxID=2697366 RepID=UPI00187B923C|nr:Na(+)/H(+) antiporter subunit B [Sneathiella sp. P13V-1]MBE7637406.1 Na(+)/H(+) antiporter subunit B [Sneathiella sp. P13V-1]
MEEFTDIFLMLLLIAGTLGVLYVSNLFVATMLLGAVSLIVALIFVTLDAVDVAFTEAAVGAGISTVLYLGTLAMVGSKEKTRSKKSPLPLLVSLAVGGLLIYATLDLPVIGSPDTPVQTSRLTDRFINVSPNEIGVPNMVTSVLASYRGFDTFGEVTVIFTAGIAVLMILRQRHTRREEEPIENPTNPDQKGSLHDIVPHVVSKLLIPFILLFGLYVQFHGDFGPGGGFQAGVIFAAGFILYSLVFGLDNLKQLISARFVEFLLAAGVLLYGGVGVVSMLMGANFLDYNVLGSTPVAGQHLGILLVELGVGITVTAAMLAIFFGFAGRPDEIEDSNGH